MTDMIDENHQAAPADFRLDDPAIQADPYPFYPLLREQEPVLASKFGDQPCWIVSRRKDISTVLMNPTIFSSRTTPIANLLFTDSPEHEQLRKMVAPMFTRTVVQPMEVSIAAKVEELLDAALVAGRSDIVEDFAGPLTIYVIGLLLGIGGLQVEYLRRLSRLRAEHVLAIRLGKTPSNEAQNAKEALDAFLADLIKSRSYAEGGVFATLAERLDTGELNQEECIAFAVLLFIAGHSTTTNLIGNAVHVLAGHPGHLDRLATDETFVTPFLEEVLRTRPSFHRILRVTTREVELAGTVIPKGAIVRLLLASANRDPAFYEDPESFDPDKKRRAHFAFGQGIHTCLGHWVARLEASTALRLFARRTAQVLPDPDRPPVPLSGGTFNEFGFERLPVLLRARA